MTAVAAPRGRPRVIRRVARLAPEFSRGLGVTLALAFVATVGRVTVPVVVEQVLDRGLRGGQVHLAVIRDLVAVGILVIAVTTVANVVLNRRLYVSTESGLATLRTAAFRHVHDLSALHQQAERRGALVSRVTGDIDEVSIFLQFGGIFLITSFGQLVIAGALMFFYSWQLALLSLGSFAPLLYVGYRVQPRLQAAYGLARVRIGDMLGAIAESIVGATVIRAHAAEERTAARIDRTVAATQTAQFHAQKLSVGIYLGGEAGAAIANACIVVAGVLLGVGGHLSLGRIVAFLFLVTLFIQPVQAATDALNEAQNALASLGRVLEVLDMEVDLADPGPAGEPLPPGPLSVRFGHVSYAYPGGPEVLHDVDLELPARRRYAVVGETGGGKTTLAKLLTRLMDPTTGTVELAGVPLTRVPFSSLRSRVVVVPQDGFLFDTTIARNVAYGREGIGDEGVARAFADLGLGDWLAGLPEGVRTPVGERGESLSVGERQLVALARAFVADPDLLVLDEATSAVDPATEARLTRALERLTDGRTSVTIAHRLSTAEAADEVLVVEAGAIVQRGTHDELVAAGGTYGRLHAAWDAQRRGSAA